MRPEYVTNTVVFISLLVIAVCGACTLAYWLAVRELASFLMR